MFGKFSLNICLLTIVLFMAGCGVFSSADGMVEPDQALSLDEEFEFVETIEKGQAIALDMRVPVSAGYEIVGASFDPELLRLDHFLQYDDDGERRVKYIFTAIVPGATDILVKMEPIGGGSVEVYKRVTIQISDV